MADGRKLEDRSKRPHMKTFLVTGFLGGVNLMTVLYSR